MTTAKRAACPHEQCPPPPPPLPCHWHEDIDGTRYLIPGCMTRIHNPDADPCDCPTVNEQLTKAREEIDALRRKRDSLQSWHDQVTRAVYDHRDGVQIMHAAARAAGAAAPEGGAR